MLRPAHMLGSPKHRAPRGSVAVSCVSFLFTRGCSWAPFESNRFAIPPQPHRQSQQRRRNDQPNPQARAAQKPSRSKLRQRNKMRIDEDAVFIGEVESFRSETKEPVAQQGVHIRSAER